MKLASFENRSEMRDANARFLSRLEYEATGKRQPPVLPPKREPYADAHEWTAKDDATLSKLRKAGASQGQIAREMNLPLGSIAYRIRKLGLIGVGGGLNKKLGQRAPVLTHKDVRP